MKNNKIFAAGLGVIALLTGVVGGGSLTQTAKAADTTSIASPAPANKGNINHVRGGHVGSNGIKEVLLTGDTAEKVKSAALAAVPGGTIIRVETDAEGSKYEAHMKKSDGSKVTVKLDENFKVTSTGSGMK